MCTILTYFLPHSRWSVNGSRSSCFSCSHNLGHLQVTLLQWKIGKKIKHVALPLMRSKDDITTPSNREMQFQQLSATSNISTLYRAPAKCMANWNCKCQPDIKQIQTLKGFTFKESGHVLQWLTFSWASLVPSSYPTTVLNNDDSKVDGEVDCVCMSGSPTFRDIKALLPISLLPISLHVRVPSLDSLHRNYRNDETFY